MQAKRRAGFLPAWIGAVALSWVVAAPALGRAAAPSAPEIVQKVREAFGQIEDYRVRIGVHVDIEGFQFPDREVVLLYKRPDRVHLEGVQFGMLPREGMMADPSQLLDPERFQVRLAGAETVRGRKTYRLGLSPRETVGEAKSELAAWVDAERWVIVQMEAESGGRKQGLVTFEHALVDRRFWLPSRTEVEIYMENLPIRPPVTQAPDSVSAARQPDRGSIQLTFHDYEVNVGLPDSLFQEEERGAAGLEPDSSSLSQPVRN